MIFYTDGSCRPTNPGPGGFGVAVIENDKLIDTIVLHYDHTTNNRMEMTAIIAAVLYAAEHGESAIIYSDSAYAINSFTTWLGSWKKKGWLKSDNTPPENLDLIKIFDELNQKYNITLNKVKGHTGKNDWNDYVDKIIWN